MNKSNVTLSHSNQLDALVDNKPIGFLIYRPDIEEFYYSYQNSPDFFGCAYVKQPARAYCFNSESLARTVQLLIPRSTEIVPLYDIGGQLAVVFDCDA